MAEAGGGVARLCVLVSCVEEPGLHSGAPQQGFVAGRDPPLVLQDKVMVQFPVKDGLS